MNLVGFKVKIPNGFIVGDARGHLTQKQFTEHWNIFISAYLGTTDPETIGAYIRRLIPFYAVKVPYIYDMSHHAALPEAAFQNMEKMLGD